MKDRKIVALPVVKRDGYAQQMTESMDEVDHYLQGDISGYAIVAWNSDGSPYVIWNNDRFAVPTIMLPAFVEECLRTNVMGWVFNDEA